MGLRGLPGGSFKPLTAEDVNQVHETAMRVIEEVGFQVNSEAVLERFRGAGARVDGEKHLVRLPRDRVMELIAMAPSEIRLCGQDERHDVLLGGSRVYTGTGGTALYVYGQENWEKRLATLEDLRRIAITAAALLVLLIVLAVLIT